MIELILPPEVASAEACDVSGEVDLFPEEEAAVARAVDKRRREFTTARGCARRALAVLGLPPVPIVPGERGAPTWPAGVVGSMTHCDGYRASAVALEERVRTVGVDAGPNGPLPYGVLEAVASPPERAWIQARAGDGSGVCWDRLLFSAKESIYKAWFPLTRRWLDFDEAVVTADPDDGTFTARLRVPGPVVDGRALTGVTGRWTVSHGLVATAIAVLAAAPAGSAEGAERPATGAR